jgi:hypothetical protein
MDKFLYQRNEGGIFLTWNSPLLVGGNASVKQLLPLRFDSFEMQIFYESPLDEYSDNSYAPYSGSIQSFHGNLGINELNSPIQTLPLKGKERLGRL